MRVSDLFEGYVKSNGPAFTLFGLRLHFYRDHVFYVVKDGPDLSIWRDGSPTPRNDEIYVKDAAARGVPKDIITIISTWLNTPKEKQKILLPRIEQALEHIAGKWISQHKAKQENTMKIDDLVAEGNKENKAKKKAVIKPTMRPKDKMSDFDPRRDLKKKVAEDKKKGKDGKACWKGYRYAGTENGKDKCVKSGK